MTGFGFTPGARASKKAVYDPAVLSLTGWWRASYSASPWTGTASAGSSGSNALSEATNPPSAGSAVNGLTPADFDGVNDTLTAAGTLDTYASSATFSGWALVYVDAQPNNLIADSAGQFYLYPDSGSFSFENSAEVVSRAYSLSAWQLITWRHTGAAIQIGVNEAPGAAGGGSSAADATAFTLAGTVSISPSPLFFDGKVLEIGMSDTALTDQNFADVKSYINSRYGLSL